jgi:hypothetical protein
VSVTPRPPSTTGKYPVPIVQEAGWPQGRSGRVRKISPPPRFDPRTVQPVASRYADLTTGPTKHEYHALNSIRTKLRNHKAIITTTHNGNSIVITQLRDYQSKISQFISDNFNTLPNDPTNQFQRSLRTTINKYPTLIPQTTDGHS